MSTLIASVAIAMFFHTWRDAGVAQSRSPCKSLPEFRQLDFWVGEWDVRDTSGAVIGTSKIQLIEDDCAILENYKGKSGYSGKSLNIYNTASGKWKQFWVDNRGGVLEFEGQKIGRELRFLGESKDSNGSSVLEKLTFYDLDGADVRQVWEQSRDVGKSWKVVFDGLYMRRE
ncbi:MAG TPA: hypothetical protein VGR15_04055 [Bacteroidota bacterium]|nr:hypothetical protein [Bacteroidota bacterium]